VFFLLWKLKEKSKSLVVLIKKKIFNQINRGLLCFTNNKLFLLIRNKKVIPNLIMMLLNLQKIHINLSLLKVKKVEVIILNYNKLIRIIKNIMMKRRSKNMNMKIMVVRKVIKVHCLMMNIYRSIIEILKQIILISYYNKLVKDLIIFKLSTNSTTFMAKN
jgi:hypothetical protein